MESRAREAGNDRLHATLRRPREAEGVNAYLKYVSGAQQRARTSEHHRLAIIPGCGEVQVGIGTGVRVRVRFRMTVKLMFGIRG